MKKNNTYNEEINEELQGMTISQLTTYARRTAIPMQPSMSKSELITYMFYFIEQCEIEQTSVRRIELPEEFNPLEFTVDLTAVTTFKDSDSKKVIHYENDSDDKDAFLEILRKAQEEEEDEIEEEIEEEVKPSLEEAKPNEITLASNDNNVDNENDNEVVEDINEEEASDDISDPVEEADLDDNEANEEVLEQVVYVDENGNEIDPNLVEGSDDISDEEIQKLLEENNLINNENEEVVEEKTININVNGVMKNEQYGSKKLEKLARGNGRLIALIISAGIALLVLVFCIWALLR